MGNHQTLLCASHSPLYLPGRALLYARDLPRTLCFYKLNITVGTQALHKLPTSVHVMFDRLTLSITPTPSCSRCFLTNLAFALVAPFLPNFTLSLQFYPIVPIKQRLLAYIVMLLPPLSVINVVLTTPSTLTGEGCLVLLQDMLLGVLVGIVLPINFGVFTRVILLFLNSMRLC